MRYLDEGFLHLSPRLQLGLSCRPCVRIRFSGIAVDLSPIGCHLALCFTAPARHFSRLHENFSSGMPGESSSAPRTWRTAAGDSLIEQATSRLKRRTGPFRDQLGNRHQEANSG